MHRFANVLKPGTTVRALWLENEPHLVQGLVRSIRLRTNPVVECETVVSAASFHKAFDDSYSAAVMDIKMSRSPDGITVARKVREHKKGLPIHFLTSFAPEYEGRLSQLPNLNGVHDRGLVDKSFADFTQSFLTDAYAYAAFGQLNVATMTWDEFLASPSQDVILAAHARLFGRLASEQLAERGWSWLAIAGEEIRDGSASMLAFPTLHEKEQMAARFGRVPFVYARPIVSEEAESEEAHPHGNYVEHFPRLRIGIGPKEAVADLDTGTNQTVVSEELTQLEPATLEYEHVHLGKPYVYGINTRHVSFRGLDAGDPVVGPVRMPVAIVREWATSPWVKVNPKRGALVGRDLFALHTVAVQIESSGDRSKVTTWVRDKPRGER